MEKKVYLLEDDSNIAELVKCALEMSNIAIECYATCAECLAAVEKSPPAVCLLDIMLPDGNGLDVLAKIKQKYSSMGVIMLSALGQETDKVKGNLSLDEDTMTATLRGVRLELNNKEFNLLKYLMQKEGKALTRENILNAVWGYDEGETRTVDNHVARLRKLGIDYIETVFGVGYKFVYKE